MKTYKVYLDTNIIIYSGKRKENKVLKNLSIERKIDLYIGSEVQSEQEGKSSKHYLKIQQEFPSFIYDLSSEHNLNKKIQEEYNKIDDFKKIEAKEWEFWQDCKLNFLVSPIDGLITLFQVHNHKDILRFDINNKIAKIGELKNKYNMSKGDIFHLMHSYSGKMDYLLTNDQKFIKKSKKFLG
jgi:predicted nucleic acid-binding protein